LAMRAPLCYILPMRIGTLRRPPAAAYAVAIAGLVVAVVGLRFVGFDTWWHLASGWVITQLETIPRHDLFSYTAFGRPWLNHQWLYQAAMWLAYENFGVFGLSTLKLVLITAACTLTFRTITSLGSSRELALCCLALFLWGASNRVMDRPVMIIMPMLALYALILHGYVMGKTRAIWALPFLQVLWVNCHGGATIGVLLVLAFALGESLQAVAGRMAGAPRPVGRVQRHRLWLVALACLAACLLNPWGAELITYYGQLRSMTMSLAYTTEWYPPLHPEAMTSILPYIYLACVAAALASHVVNARGTRITHLLITAFAALLLTQGRRFGPEAMILCLPVIAYNLSERFPRLRVPSPEASWAILTAVFALSTASLAFGVPTTFRRAPDANITASPSALSAPARMVDFLEYHGIRGRVLNDLGIGGYLIFRRWPRELVYFDGRTPVYGEDFFRENTAAFQRAENFERLKDRWEFDYIVLSGMGAWGSREFHRYLWENPDWHLVYGMEDGYVYLRDVPKFKGLIEKLALDRHPVIEHMKEKGELPEDYSR